MNISRCSFNGGALGAEQRTVIFDATVGAGVTAYGHITNVVSNDQLFTSDTIRPTYNLTINGENYNGIVPNKDITLNSESLINETGDMQLSVEYSNTTSNILSPVIDSDRVGSIVVRNRFGYAQSSTDTGSALGETQTNSAGASTTARYVSKKVYFGNLVADDLAVFLDIALNQGHVKVFAKVNNDDENFDNVNWVQLYKDGDNTAEGEWFNDVVVDSLTPMTFKPATGTSLGEFDVYAIKVVLFGGSNDHSADNMPVVKNLRAIALQT